MFLLDTNTLIYFFRGAGKVADRLLSCMPTNVGLSAITVYELEVGIAKSNQPAKRRQQLDALLDVIRIYSFDLAVAKEAAMIRARLEKKGQPIGPMDVLIAATARANNATLVTHNTNEFKRVSGLDVVDWYS